MSRLQRYALLISCFLVPACVMDDAADDWAELAIADDHDELSASQASGTRVRVMAANITSGNFQSYDPGHGIRIFRGTDPDIVLIQELNFGNNSNAAIRSFVDAAFGPSYSFFRESGAQIPNGIISRYPIIESGEWIDPFVSNRDFAYARIDIPGPVDLWAVSVHFLTSSATSRNNQAQELISQIRQHVPAGDYLIIGGDFNTGSRTESAISTLSQEVITAGPFPADHAGNTNTNATRSKPFDWVLVDADLAPREIPVTIGTSSFPRGAVIDTRVYTPLFEIGPARRDDSGAPGMQHQAVIRDFRIPAIAGSPRVFLNEILANEPGSDTSGEFVEIVNTGTAPADLSGWRLSDASSTRHVFPAGTTLSAGRSIVVFGGPAGIPPGTPGAVAASTGTLSLSNSSDTVTLRNASGQTIDSFTYSSSLASQDGVSMNRSPDASATGSFVLHNKLSAGGASPGTRVNGAFF